MYARAQRALGQTIGSTPLHIGPGTYDVSSAEKKSSLEAYAPFLSLTIRDNQFYIPQETPGPGQYELKVTGTVKGCSSLANRSQRFSIKREEVPGPGAYVVENKENRQSFAYEYPKVSKQRVTFNRKQNAPSIQDPKLAYGYEESPSGELVPQPPPERDETLGPAYYSMLTGNPSSTTAVYKGVHFGKYSSKRTEFTGKPGPGPGEYDVINPVQVDVEHYHIKNAAERKPELAVPRYPDTLIKTIEKEKTPGPGKYEQKRLFDDSFKQVEFLGIEPERPPFGVQSKRFDTFKTLAPGPGAYNEIRTALTGLNKIHGLKKTPFSQSSVRFQSDGIYKSRSAPGPGQYRVPGFAEENLRRAIIDSRRKPAFGQTEKRKFNLTKKDEYAAPGPAQYSLVEKPFRPKKENATANFASNTKRDFQVEDTPGPTAYDVPKSYDHLIHPRREAPRNRVAMKRQESFNITSRRQFNLASNDFVPGPGAYDQPATKSKANVARLTDQRWKASNKEKLPGPADYEFSPMYQDTLLKGTFNATLNNPFVLKQKQKAASESNLNMTLNTSKLGLQNSTDKSADQSKLA